LATGNHITLGYPKETKGTSKEMTKARSG